MSFKTSGCIALLGASLSASACLALPTPAYAANFFERLLGIHQRQDRYDRGPMSDRYGQQRGRYGNGDDQYGYRQEPAPAPKPVHVSKVHGPKYYTYKPDRLTVASLGKLTDPVTTGSVASDGLPSLSDNPFEYARRYLADVKIRALPEVVAAIKAHYSSDPNYIWVSGSAINGRARAVLTVLANAESVGLDPADYRVDVPADAYDASDQPARDKALMSFEMHLSSAVLSYVLDAERGRVAPDRISGYHDMPRKKVDLKAALSKLQTAGDAGQWLASRNPQGQQFKELKDELATLRAATPTNQVKVPDGTLIHPGESDPAVPTVVAAVKQHASDDLKTKFADTLTNYDGGTKYSPDIVSLVRAYQKEKGLHQDGVVGKNTVAAMTGFDNADKVNKIVLAMERARWLPGVLPAKRVFVNEASFTATYFAGNTPKLATRVIVGRKSHQTNFFSDQIETVEFNPYWGVPQSIIINEMLPKLRASSSYLDRMGYQLEYKGKKISSSSVNWNAVSSTKAFSVRQPPGQENALGQLKILFPNSHAIYLHDTPTKSLFKRSVRDYSHGCVRMQDPRGMAAEVLGISRQKVADYIHTGRNQGVDVPHKIPVYLAYFTAWPNATGKIGFYKDVYDRDMYLNKAIDSTEAERHAEG